MIVTEGDSAKTFVNWGLDVVGRHRYGTFPLSGKIINVRQAKHKQIIQNSWSVHLLHFANALNFQHHVNQRKNNRLADIHCDIGHLLLTNCLWYLLYTMLYTDRSVGPSRIGIVI